MSALLTVDDLRVEYLTDRGRICVVDGVSLTVGRDEIVGLAGESGSGKSTVLKGILRLLGPPAAITGGDVHFDGRDLLALDEEGLRRVRWRGISLVMQSALNALNPVMTVRDQIADAIAAHEGAQPPGARIAELLHWVGLDPARMDL